MRKFIVGAMLAGVVSLGAAQAAIAEGTVGPPTRGFFPAQPVARGRPGNGRYNQPYGRRGRNAPQASYPGTYGYPTQQRPVDGDDQGGTWQGGYQTPGRQGQDRQDQDWQNQNRQDRGRQDQGRQTGRNTRTWQQNHGR